MRRRSHEGDRFWGSLEPRLAISSHGTALRFNNSRRGAGGLHEGGGGGRRCGRVRHAIAPSSKDC